MSAFASGEFVAPVALAAKAPATGSSSAPRGARLAVLGAGGYAGGEFVRLCAAHPGLEIVAVGAREGGEVSLATLARAAAAGEFDALVACLPHGVWRRIAAEHPALAAEPAYGVDLSGDHRGGEGGYRYGIPEAFREEIASATRIANPGCYPTAAGLALLPALGAGWVEGPVTITALSGVSGAGRAPALHTSFVEVEGGASAYRAGGDHPHRGEIASLFARLAGEAVETAFVPQLVPMARGILLTASARLKAPRESEALHALYERAYAEEPFVRLLAPGDWPRTHAVRASNRCDVSVTAAHGGRTLVAIAALDNLGKGAAGQAVQNLNLMLGWPETTGLARDGAPW